MDSQTDRDRHTQTDGQTPLVNYRYLLYHHDQRTGNTFMSEMV